MKQKTKKERYRSIGKAERKKERKKERKQQRNTTKETKEIQN